MVDAAMSPPSEAETKTDVSMSVEMEPESKPALTPPTSESSNKKDDDSDSELSELEPETGPEAPGPNSGTVQDDAEIVPDHYYEGGKIPVFKPTMNQFRSFKDFIRKVDKYGMKSGIVKVVPPREWRDALPPLDDQVKTIKVKNPITQEFHGSHGTYTQANIEKQRSYNLPQWKALSEESNHQPPAKRGERRRNQEKPSKGASAKFRTPPVNGKKRGPGRPRTRPIVTPVKADEDAEDTNESKVQVPPTPTSPPLKATRLKKEHLSDDEDAKPKGRQPKSVSSRRQHNKQSQAEIIDEEAFRDFDYRVHNQHEWTTERIQELETAYWKGLTFNNPLYGADMPGSLFDDSTPNWNVAKLENLLDVLGQKVPGVNTAYLYLGMWKASFAWHLEDVDLYSINYIHFGAPKQWYSISQEDARRFEAAMRSVWPNDAKNCDQFLRHKTYLISPQLLQSQYNIKVNRLVHNEGEFVITFPYGYHSGYNLGYNCAESVNFATDSWLDYGRVARKCNCESDSVWVDVREIERKLRGEPTPEYYEETEDDDDEDEEEDEPTDLPTPPGSDKGKPKRSHKRKRDPADKEGKKKIKKIRIKIRAPSYEPCVLCPNDNRYEKLLPTDNGHMAHRRCGLYTPETCVALDDEGTERVLDVARIDKARLELKCNYCRSKRGAAFQCSQKKCTRAYHATCAAQAGVQVDVGLIPVFGEDGTEYTDTGIDFRCRFHRSKRSKNADSITLEDNTFIRKNASKISIGEVVQAQSYQGEIFAGSVVENRKTEQTVLLEVLPKGDRFEVEYKWLLIFDPVNSQLPMPSESAKPLPAELLRKWRTTVEDPTNVAKGPKADDPFCDAGSIFKWCEFDSCRPIRNPAQVKVDLSKPDQLWYFLGKPSTEAKAQYTHDLAIKVNNVKANFLEAVRLASLASRIPPPLRKSMPASYPTGFNQHAINAARANAVQPSKTSITALSKSNQNKERPYHGKYAIKDPVTTQFASRAGMNVDTQSLLNQRAFQQRHAAQISSQYSHPHHHYQSGQNPPNHIYRAPSASMYSSTSMAPMRSNSAQIPSPPTYKAPPPYNFNRPPPDKQAQSQQYSQQSYQRPQAPVANMMGGSQQHARPGTDNINRMQMTQKHPPAPTMSSVPPGPSASAAAASPDVSACSIPVAPVQEIKRISRLPLPEKYLYLHEAEKARPQVYQSPYEVGGGFTAPYLPAPTASTKGRPRGPSISADFLMKRTASQQETVAAKMSEGKARLLQQQNEQLQRRQSINQPQYSVYSSQPSYHQRHHSQPQDLHLSTVQQPRPSSSSHISQAPSSYFDSRPNSSYQHYSPYSVHNYTPNYSPHTTHHQTPHQYNQHQSHYQQSPQQSYPSQNYSPQSTGLQFQSPHDFQMQVEREAQRPSGYDNFLRGMQTAAGGHNQQQCAQGYNSMPAGGQGSPLKYEFGNGGEMLPMMKPEDMKY